MKTKVVNKYKHKPTENDLYIGRGSKWGNPYKMPQDGNRSEVIDKYKEYLKTRPDLIKSLPELQGKNLVCFCAPKPCHGDVLVMLCEKLLD